MGDKEKDILTAQHAIILKKLGSMETKVSRAEGAFWTTSVLGVILIGLITIIYTGVAETIKKNTEVSTSNTKDIAIIKTKDIELDKWRDGIDEFVEKARFVK